MYNRYVPQPDGSYQRNRMQDAYPIPQPKHDPQPQPQPLPPPPEVPVCSPPPPRHKHSAPKPQEGAFGFLKNLLPKELDTGDLMIILLLLLMAGDCEESRSSALLTLALYFLL